MKITEKQKRFADYYIETGNATESYFNVYKCKRETADANGARLLGNARIKAYIDEKIAEKDEQRIAKQDEVLEYLTKVLRGQETERLPIVGKDYFEMIDNTPSIKDRTKAAELLGKRYTMWTDRQQLEGNIGVTIVDDIDD